MGNLNCNLSNQKTKTCRPECELCASVVTIQQVWFQSLQLVLKISKFLQTTKFTPNYQLQVVKMPSCEHFCCQDCAKNFFTLVSGEILLFIALAYSCSMFVLVLTFPIIISTGCHRPKHQPGSLSFLQVTIDITYHCDIIEIIHTPNTLNLSSSSPSPSSSLTSQMISTSCF